MPATAMLTAPAVDMTLSGESIDGRAELDPMLSRSDTNEFSAPFADA